MVSFRSVSVVWLAAAGLAVGQEAAAPQQTQAGYLGVVTAPAPDGERVVTIDPQGPAAAAGIKVGDTLLKFDGQSLTPQNSLLTQMRPKKATQNVTLSVRDSTGKVEEKAVTLRERPTALPRGEGRMPADLDRVPGLGDMIDRAQFMQPGPRPMLGVTVAEIDHDLRERLKLGNVNGVLINEVRANTPAADAKLQANDVIQSVDNQQVTNPVELQRIVAGSKPDSQVKLKIFRNGQTIEVPVTVKTMTAPAMPGMPGMGRFPSGFPGMGMGPGGDLANQVNELKQRISMLESRIEALERRIGGTGREPRQPELKAPPGPGPTPPPRGATTPPPPPKAPDR
jgi:membrane-associated protease RseP (regulator of RpoE activity)